MMVNVVMIFDENGEVIQYGGKDNLYGTFDDAKKCAEELREASPACRAYPRVLMRRAK